MTACLFPSRFILWRQSTLRPRPETPACAGDGSGFGNAPSGGSALCCGPRVHDDHRLGLVLVDQPMSVRKLIGRLFGWFALRREAERLRRHREAMLWAAALHPEVLERLPAELRRALFNAEPGSLTESNALPGSLSTFEPASTASAESVPDAGCTPTRREPGDVE